MSHSRRTLLPLFFALLLLLLGSFFWSVRTRPSWNAEEVAILRGLWIGSLPPLPPDPSNRYADQVAAAQLGHALFFDTRFSVNGQVACASCHLPDQQFQDGLPVAQAIGRTRRRTMPLVGVAYSPWFFWDGSKDSLWSQALAPLENAVEHGSNRTYLVQQLAQFYQAEYEAIFGPLPDLRLFPDNAGPVTDPLARQAWRALSAEQQHTINSLYANMGKALAAYQRRLLPAPSRFDRYVEAILTNQPRYANTLLIDEEINGLRLFIGKGNCLDCHNGPLFTDFFFHNTGVPTLAGGSADLGRAEGLPAVLADQFNCLGRYSDAQPEQCPELRFLKPNTPQLARQFKTPTLRNVAQRPPYMHHGEMATLEDVLDHYLFSPLNPATALLGHNELEPITLTLEEQQQLIAFLHTLDSPIQAEAHWLIAPDLP